MANIKTTEVGVTTDQTKRVVAVRFTPHGPNPARLGDVEVIFEIKRSDNISLLGQDPFALILLSCTDCDTRQPYALSNPQRNAVIDAAMEAALEDVDG
mgnify:CR=1 FL=1